MLHRVSVHFQMFNVQQEEQFEEFEVCIEKGSCYLFFTSHVFFSHCMIPSAKSYQKDGVTIFDTAANSCLIALILR